MPDEDGGDAGRALWPHEALDFTPWLAAHLDLLGEAIGLRLEPTAREHPVGRLSPDILARDAGADVPVAIANQLAAADLSHLGRLITYATGSGAPVAVRVATAFRRELADAVHRLNGWTPDGIRSHAVQVEVVQHAPDAQPEPRFRRVVWPGGRDESLVLAAAEPSPEAQRYQDFFDPLLAELVRTGFAGRPVQHFDHTGRFFRSRIDPGIGYAASIWRGAAWVGLHIRMDGKTLTRRVFDELHADKEAIEADLPAPDGVAWSWLRHDAFAFSSINLRRDGAIHDPPDSLAETRAWMLDALPRLRAVLDPRLATILHGLGAPDRAEGGWSPRMARSARLLAFTGSGPRVLHEDAVLYIGRLAAFPEPAIRARRPAPAGSASPSLAAPGAVRSEAAVHRSRAGAPDAGGAAAYQPALAVKPRCAGAPEAAARRRRR